MNVKVVTNDQELNDAFSVRKTVFVGEQNVPEEEEIDQYEQEATHFILYANGEPAGAGRFRIVDGLGKIERICVLKTLRGTGAGSALMAAIEKQAQTKGIPALKLNAQTHAIPFYSRLGYEVISEEFLDAGIPHKTMKKKI
ncbi:GNAT family N-acetyltransferase [Bacillus sp. B15-48]|uniref:GNAT family N-acetyltransferase n=1 Tax=Bacillus sp. B15-48 TaxID=1548601 RepID=UPI0019400B6A|nr:GNAT family N-acetyltransferase [Bacillus sp. B15-48]